MKKILKNHKNTDIYDFSDYAEEITGDALFKINGGVEVENSNEGIAGAKPGDTITRNDGTVVTLNQGDIDYANAQLGNTGNTGASNTISNSGNKNNSSSSSNNTGTSSGSATSEVKKEEKKEPSPAVMYDSHDPSRVFVDLDNPKAMQQAADLLAEPSLGLRVTAYGSESGITKNFKNYQEINDYLNNLPNKDNGKYLVDNEYKIKGLLMRIEQNPDDYNIEGYQRRAITTGKITELLTHSLFIIEEKSTNSISTLSYNGTVLLPFSKGAWGLNTETDVSSYESFKDGSNDYDMRLIYSANKINPEMTAKNIIQSIDSRTTYFMIDHLCDIIGKENCNTAFFNTIVLK